MSSSTPATARDAARIESLIGGEDGRLAELGIDVEAVEITPAGKRRVLRVAVDKDGGVTLDDVATATKIIDAAVEDADVMGEQPFTLEVTSRGVDRPLTRPRHWRRNRGRLVKVALADGSSLTGRVVESDETTVTLRLHGDETAPSAKPAQGGRRPSTGTQAAGAEKVLVQADITKALVQIEFNRKDED